MLRLALRSLRHRPTGFTASFVATFLGAAILMGFASMLDTSAGDGVDATSEETLTTMAMIVGGWGLLLVLFAVASTLTLSVRQRAAEMALLKNVGATPAQLGRMIVGEAAVVALVGAVAAILPAVLAGRALLWLLKETDQVASGVGYRFGPVAISMGLGITVLAATGAALVTARRAARMRPADSLLDAATGTAKMSRKRIVAACLFLALGLNMGTLTATVMHGKGMDAMQTAGQASIWASIGLALLAPGLVRMVIAVIGRPLQRLTGVSGYLTVLNMRRRTQQMASILMPIILFTGISTATLYLQSVENAAETAEGMVKNNEQNNIQTLNLVVVGMIALFAAIMLINTLVAATTHRRQEFGQQRLTGATPGQVLRVVRAEAIVLAAAGVVFGSLASLVTILPFSYARTDSFVPDAPIWIYVGIVAAAVALTLATSLRTTHRGLRVPAVEAVAA